MNSFLVDSRKYLRDCCENCKNIGLKNVSFFSQWNKSIVKLSSFNVFYEIFLSFYIIFYANYIIYIFSKTLRIEGGIEYKNYTEIKRDVVSYKENIKMNSFVNYTVKECSGGRGTGLGSGSVKVGSSIINKVKTIGTVINNYINSKNNNGDGGDGEKPNNYFIFKSHYEETVLLSFVGKNKLLEMLVNKFDKKMSQQSFKNRVKRGDIREKEHTFVFCKDKLKLNIEEKDINECLNNLEIEQ
jgi:hypothetical protein